MNSKKDRDNNTTLLQRKNKAIKDCKDKYEKIASQNTKIIEQNIRIHEEIERQCQRLNETLAKLKLKSQEYMSHCLLALTEQKKNPQVTCVSQLAAYLKIQKQLLKSITDSKQQQKTTKIDLHDMLGKVQLERVLRKLKKEQLEQQIKFLQSNVLVKGNFIYNPSSSLFTSPAQEKEKLARIQNLVNQLERVIKLSIPCATHANHNNKLAVLTSQQARISNCERILQEEQSKVLKYTKFIEDMRFFQEKFTYGEPYMKDCLMETEVQNHYQEKSVNLDELDEFLSMKTVKQIVINFEHPFTVLESNIAQLRKKIKKIENYSS